MEALKGKQFGRRDLGKTQVYGKSDKKNLYSHYIHIKENKGKNNLTES